jgi:uncharacterized membrane protein
MELIEGINPLPNVIGRICPQELQCQGVCAHVRKRAFHPAPIFTRHSCLHRNDGAWEGHSAVLLPSPSQNKLQVAETSWQGLLPSPAALQQFNTLVENGAERIFRMTELEQEHRLKVQDKSLTAGIEAQQNEAVVAKLGLCFGAIVSVLSIVAFRFCPCTLTRTFPSR